MQKNCNFAKEKQEAGSKLIGILSEPIKSKIRLTKQIPDGSLQGKCDRDFITLTAGVETYDEARKIFSDDCVVRQIKFKTNGMESDRCGQNEQV